MAPINKDSPINNDAFAYVIGVDFGTTFSGAAYVFIQHANHNDIYDIRNWPKNNGQNLFKIPTIIRYHKEDPNLYICGLEALESKNKTRDYGSVNQLFKLHLHEDTKDGIPELPDGLSILKVISDYLRYLHRSICKEIKNALGDKVDFEKKKESFRYCLTVPALWTPEAKSVMREAAIVAGIINKNDHVDRLVLVGEPEAAALYAEKMKGGITIKSGETLMIVDAGGGTIDLTTFEKTIEGEIKCFKEITEGVGNTFGSARLDLNFREYILRKMKGHPALDDVFLEKLLNHFRKEVKLSVGDSFESNAYFQISCSGSTIESNDFTLTEDSLEIPMSVIEKEVFDPVVEKIISLIGFQLEKLNGTRLNYINLVGGFGQSQYLLTKIQEKFSDKVDDIIVPAEGELAVTRGAVYFGLNPYSISHRRMRLSYGLSISSPFIEGVDRLDYRKKDKEGRYVCVNRFDPFVKKGDDVSIQVSVTRSYYTYNSRACHIKLYGYEGDTIPRYVSDSAKKNSNFSNEAYKVAEFVLNLPVSQPGEKTSFIMEVYFGHMEIKIEVTLPGFDEKRTFIASYDQIITYQNPNLC